MRNPATPFELDASQPFRVEFGRGSGSRGLSVVVIDHTGRVTSTRPAASGGWESTSLKMSEVLLTQLVAAVNAERLAGLAPLYDGNAHDGTQWVLWIEQGANTQAVYFNNEFPPAIERFANALDGLLARAGIAGASWRLGKNIDAPLWNRITPATAATTTRPAR